MGGGSVKIERIRSLPFSCMNKQNRVMSKQSRNARKRAARHKSSSSQGWAATLGVPLHSGGKKCPTDLGLAVRIFFPLSNMISPTSDSNGFSRNFCQTSAMNYSLNIHSSAVTVILRLITQTHVRIFCSEHSKLCRSFSVWVIAVVF